MFSMTVGLRRLVATIALGALGACSAVPTGGSAADGRHAWTIPDTLRVGTPVVPRTLNPILSTQTIEGSLARLVTDILVSVDEHGAFVPMLAREVPTQKNGDISSDGRTIRYRLRSGVKWHDGAAFTSKDVKFTFDAIMNPKNDVISRHGYDIVDRVTTPDDATVIFHLKTAFAPAIGTIFGESDSPYGILPEHLLAKYPSLNDVPFNSAPIGTGPFKIVSWQRGDRITYARNDEYFLGKPKLKTIVVRLVPDENTLITQLRTHEIDWLFEGSVTAYHAIKTIPDITIKLTPFNGFNSLMFNNAKGPLADVRLRRALVMAIDKKRLVDAITFGTAVQAKEDLPSFLWAYDPNVPEIRYDPVGAKAQLAALGYGPGKKALDLNFVFEQSTVTNKTLAVQIQSILHEWNVDVHLRPELSSVIYGGYGANGTLARGNYDMAIYLWIAGIDPDNSAQFTCANRPPAGFNHSYFCSKAMDAAQVVALSSFDQAKRKAAYRTIEASLATDAAQDFLWWPRWTQATNPDLKHFDPNPVVETWDARNWEI